MTPPTPGPEPIHVIAFTRRVARQCRVARPRVPDCAVCDAIANGTRTALAGRGPRGGRVFRFDRVSPGSGRLRGGVSVLVELTRAGCVALGLLLPAGGGKKTGRVWDF